MSSLRVEVFSGDQIGPYLNDLARLRISVFREYPYLYDGSEEYESDYVKRYTDSVGCVFVLAFDNEQVVGASTAQPLINEIDEFKQPFISNGYKLETIFYLAESVLLPDYRRQGIGHRFFEEREAFASKLGDFKYYTFCAVERAFSHPRCPVEYNSHDAFWNKRGYFRQERLKTLLSWKEIDEDKESPKPMIFWIKELSATSFPARP